MTARRKWLVGGSVAAVAVIALGGFALWWFFLRDDAPPPATLEQAVAGVTDTTTSTSAAPETSATGSSSTTRGSSTSTVADDPDSAVAGKWSVDTTVGSFADFTSSWVGYRIDEELDPIGANTAVGRTPAVSGELTIEGTALTDVSIEADLTQLESDNGIRDNQIRGRGLQTDTFPTGTFELTEPLELGEVPAPDTPISVDATGELTLHGTTNPVTIALEAQLVEDLIVVVGSTEVALVDYGIDPPTGLRVLGVADTGTMEFSLLFSRS